MSTYYSIYVEALSKGKWQCIDLYRKNTDGTYDLAPVFWSGSRSYFGEAADKLTQIGSRVSDPSTLSPELGEYLKNCFKDDFAQCTYAAYYHDLRRLIPDLGEHDRHGVVHKNAIFAFEKSDVDDIYPVDDAEYEDLSETQKNSYQYYEWDDPMGWLCNLKALIRSVEALIMMDGWEHDTDVLRLIMTVA